MESWSAGLTSEPFRGLPEYPVPRSPSEESLNLTVVLGDGAADAVGAGRPDVGPIATSLGTVTSAQVRGVAEHDRDLVREPVCFRAMIQELCVRTHDTGDVTIPTYI